MNQNNLFNNIEKQSNVNINEVLKLANSLKGANFKDEKTIRAVVSRVAKMANVTVSKQKEDELVKAIVNNRIPQNLQDLSKMLK